MTEPLLLHITHENYQKKLSYISEMTMGCQLRSWMVRGEGKKNKKLPFVVHI